MAKPACGRRNDYQELGYVRHVTALKLHTLHPYCPTHFGVGTCFRGLGKASENGEPALPYCPTHCSLHSDHWDAFLQWPAASCQFCPLSSLGPLQKSGQRDFSKLTDPGARWDSSLVLVCNLRCVCKLFPLSLCTLQLLGFHLFLARIDTCFWNLQLLCKPFSVLYV